MAKLGRPRTPDALKILSGTMRPDRQPQEALAVPTDLPPCPSYLDETAREEWDRILGILAKRPGVLTEGDGPALGLYCAAFSRFKKAMDDIEVHGVLTESATGTMKPSPSVVIAEKASRMMSQILADFGLTPSSRGKLTVGSSGPKDELAEFQEEWKAS